MANAARSPLLLAFGLWLAGLGAAGQFAKFGVVFDVASARYADAATPAVLGLLVSGVGMAGLLFGSTAGVLIARTGARRALVAALAAGAVLSLVEALLPPLGPLLALRFLEGFSHLAIVVAGPVIIAEASTGKDRAFAMTLWSTFFGVAFAIMGWAGRPLALATGLPALFAAHGFYMASMAVLMLALLPADARRPADAWSVLAFLRQHGDIYASPRIAAPALGFLFYTLMYVAVLALLPPMTGAWQGFLTTATPFVSIVASMTLGVHLVNRLSPVVVVQAGFAVAALSALALWIGWTSEVVMVGASLLFSAAVGLVQSASFAAIPELNDTPDSRAAATGAIAQLGNVGTTIGTPILAALIAAWGVNGLGFYLTVLALFGVAVHAWQKSRRRQS